MFPLFCVQLLIFLNKGSKFASAFMQATVWQSRRSEFFSFGGVEHGSSPNPSIPLGGIINRGWSMVLRGVSFSTSFSHTAWQTLAICGLAGAEKGGRWSEMIIGRSSSIWGGPPPYFSFMHQLDNLFNHQYHVISIDLLRVAYFIA